MKNAKPPKAQPLAVAQFAQILCRCAALAFRLLSRPSTLVQLPSLVGKSLSLARPMFIIGINNGKLAGLIQNHTPVTFVCSHPRSGNTWMRYLLSDVLLQNHGVQTTTELPQPARLVPYYHHNLITPRAATATPAGYLIKTHDMIATLQERVGGHPGVRQCRYLYLFRAPEDVLVSVFHYSLLEKYIRSNSGGDIDLFCLEYLPAWMEHVTSYLDALDGGVTVYLVCYEELLRQPATVLSDTLRWLGIPHTPAIVQRAESNMRFGKLQAMEERSFNVGGRLFRRGVEGSGASELKPETLSQIRAATKDIVARANQSLARQRWKERPEPAPPSSASELAADSHNRCGETTPASSA